MQPSPTRNVVVSDVLVNRRRGRFDIAIDEGELALIQYGNEERIRLTDLSDAELHETDRRMRLRFRTPDGSQWTIRWYDGSRLATKRLIELLDLHR